MNDFMRCAVSLLFIRLCEKTATFHGLHFLGDCTLEIRFAELTDCAKKYKNMQTL